MIKKTFYSFRSISRFFFDNISIIAIKSLPYEGTVSLVDIGAAGEIEPRWKPFSKILKYTGFEPDERSYKILQNEKNNFLSYDILPFALSKSKDKVPINFCKKPQVSSFYKPNHNFLNRFSDSDRFSVVKTKSIKVVSLDSLNIQNADFIKIDTQGSELDIIKGSKNTLNDVLGLEVEVEFLNLYKNQPLFGDICTILSKYGFEFFDYVNLCRWERNAHNSFGQCVFGDAIFLKSPEKLKFDKLSLKKISSYLSILLIYRRFDLIELVLKLISKDDRKKFHKFENLFKKIKKRGKFVRKIFIFINSLFSLFGRSYRIHLIE